MERREDQRPRAESGPPAARDGDAERPPAERAVVPPVVPNADRAGSADRAPPAPTARRSVDTPARRAALDDMQIRLERGDIDGAIARLDRLLAEVPDDVELLCARGTLYTHISRFDRATADLRRATRAAEHDPRVLLASGMLACKRAQWRDAIEPLREAAALEPGDAVVQYYLGEAYNHVDELGPALTAFERAVELAPTHWRAIKGVAVVLDRLGRRDEATDAYRRSREARSP